MGDMPIIPIYFYVRGMLIQPSVKGWNPTLLDYRLYYQFQFPLFIFSFFLISI